MQKTSSIEENHTSLQDKKELAKQMLLKGDKQEESNSRIDISSCNDVSTQEGEEEAVKDQQNSQLVSQSDLPDEVDFQAEIQKQPVSANFQTLLYLMRYVKVQVTPKVMAAFLSKTLGRVQVNKISIFFIKLMLWKFPQTKGSNKKNSEHQWQQGAKNLLHAFNTTRRTMLFGQEIASLNGFQSNWKSLRNMIAEKQSNKSEILMQILSTFNSLCEIIINLCDDISFLSYLKVLKTNSKWDLSKKASKYGTNLWFITNLIDQFSAHLSANKNRKELNEQRQILFEMETQFEQIKQQDEYVEGDNLVSVRRMIKNLNTLKQEIQLKEELYVNQVLSAAKLFTDLLLCIPEVLAENNTRFAEFGSKYPQFQIFSGLVGAILSWLVFLKKNQPDFQK